MFPSSDPKKTDPLEIVGDDFIAFVVWNSQFSVPLVVFNAYNLWSSDPKYITPLSTAG